MVTKRCALVLHKRRWLKWRVHPVEKGSTPPNRAVAAKQQASAFDESPGCPLAAVRALYSAGDLDYGFAYVAAFGAPKLEVQFEL